MAKEIHLEYIKPLIKEVLMERIISNTRIRRGLCEFKSEHALSIKNKFVVIIFKLVSISIRTTLLRLIPIGSDGRYEASEKVFNSCVYI